MTGFRASLAGTPRAGGLPAGRSFARADALLLALLLALGLAIRVWIALVFPAIDHPDEIYQATEQAHRLVFGYGVVPWEFRIGARNWLLPGFLAALLAPAARLWPAPQDYLAALAVALGALSLLSVWAAYEIGRRFSRIHGLAAGFAAAVWFELAYFGVRPLSESVATNFLLVAVALLTGEARTRTRLFWGGVALGAAFVFRFHLAPVLAIVGLAAGRRDWRGGWLPMMLGAALPVACLGIVDTATWGQPFGSILTNFTVNAFGGRASAYGTSPALWYLTLLNTRWGLVLAVMAPLIGFGAARKPLLLVVAVVIIAGHSFIPHKEYRFIVPAIACLVVLAGLGIGEAVSQLGERLKGVRGGGLVLPGALLLFALASGTLAQSFSGQARLTVGRNWLDAFAALHADPDLCGLAVTGGYWVMMPGYSGLHRPVPIYFWERLVETGQTGAANTIVSGDRNDGPPPDPAFSTKTCFQHPGSPWPTVCVYRRLGACAVAPGLDINAELARRGE